MFTKERFESSNLYHFIPIAFPLVIFLKHVIHSPEFHSVSTHYVTFSTLRYLELGTIAITVFSLLVTSGGLLSRYRISIVAAVLIAHGLQEVATLRYVVTWSWFDDMIPHLMNFASFSLIGCVASSASLVRIEYWFLVGLRDRSLP